MVDEYFSAGERCLVGGYVLVGKCIELPEVPCKGVDTDKALEACDDT
jgi:hypothetical protein